MKTIFHKSDTRGHAQHSWLDSRHTFSFARYYDPERMNFGVLRVLNDDIVRGGMGFGTHPHENMEIISIPLEGALKHKDSMGNSFVIRKNDIQVMSAGTGIYHSEYNNNSDTPTHFLQIWIIPREQGVEPRYDQLTIPPEARKNTLKKVLSPHPDDEGVWIHQNAWFYLGLLDVGYEQSHSLNKQGNGIYFFIIEGRIRIGEQVLNRRDGFGISGVETISLQSMADQTEVLIMEVPMAI